MAAVRPNPKEAGYPELCGGFLGRDLVELGELLASAGEADLQAVDLAESAFAAGFCDAGVPVNTGRSSESMSMNTRS
jgi:hypothetical protein